MKFICPQFMLSETMNYVSGTTGKNPNLPILGNVLIKADAELGIVDFITTNIESTVTRIVNCRVEVSGELTVPCQIFSNLISLLDNNDVNIEKIENSLKIVCNNYQTVINGISSEEFPVVTGFKKTPEYSVRLSVDSLKKALNQVAFAVSQNESRPEIAGVYFKSVDRTLTLVGTDSYRLSETKINILEKSGNELSLIIPSRSINELTRIINLIKENEGEIVMVSDNSIIAFYLPTATYLCRTLEGKYPNYTSLIQTEFQNTIHIDRQQLIRAIKASSLFSKDGMYDIYLQFSNNNLLITSKDNFKGNNEVSLPVEMTGGDNSICVNYRYLVEGLEKFTTHNIQMFINDGNRPCITKPGDGSEALYLVMPIRK